MTLHVTVFNLITGYQAFIGAYYLRLHHKVTPNTTQHTARMQMPQYKLAPLLTLQCYIHMLPAALTAGNVTAK